MCSSLCPEKGLIMAFHPAQQPPLCCTSCLCVCTNALDGLPQPCPSCPRNEGPCSASTPVASTPMASMPIASTLVGTSLTLVLLLSLASGPHTHFLYSTSMLPYRPASPRDCVRPGGIWHESKALRKRPEGDAKITTISALQIKRTPRVTI